MSKIETLILLINSMTKAEKRSFSLNRKTADYTILFDLINKNSLVTPTLLRKQYSEARPNSNFNVTVSYLYKNLLDTLLYLQENNDTITFLLNQLLKARILFDKAIYDEALDMLNQVKIKARESEIESIFLSAAQLELEYLHFLNFPNISERELLSKHMQVNESLKIIRRVNEQSVLHELMKHRILYKDNVRSERQKEALNDLVVSEMSVIASSNIETFEIKKQHQLFQSAYLISVGDYKSALRSYHELNKLFEENERFWLNPPVYYLMALEGILDSLRSIKEYDSMIYFIDKMKSLKLRNLSASGFQLNLASLIFLYELFPMLDSGQFAKASKWIDANKEGIIDKMHLLPLNRQAAIALYTSLAYFGQKNYKEAHRVLVKVFLQGQNFHYLPLYRTIRLVNLMTLYEMGTLNDYDFEIRSFSRAISKIKKAYRLEHVMLRFFRKQSFSSVEREAEWKKLSPLLENISNDIYEKQLLRLFDFTAWIESKLLKLPLSEVLDKKWQS